MNSQMPSEQQRMGCPASSANLLTPGWWITPTACATRSPMALDMARPGTSCPLAKTRWGTSPSMRTTSPPWERIRRRSSGSCGLWSMETTVPTPDGVILDMGEPPLPAVPAAQRESPTQAKTAERSRRSTTQTERVVPLRDTSNLSTSLQCVTALCTASKMSTSASFPGSAPFSHTSAHSSLQQTREAHCDTQWPLSPCPSATPQSMKASVWTQK
mmetsp:Transcript_84509/g.182142  ORF Transcript_84509/g.182142 Transcript_84509/m.182142 type:complete len:215 (+) Transcript_84509:322-966(+)